MNTISHSAKIPFVTLYWDYYILSRLHHDVAMVLQRFEFWDGTKASGSIHNEQLNEQLELAGASPTQETSRWFYKSQEELAWELMGVTCEKKLSARTRAEKPDTFRIFDFLIDELHYVEWRNNPDLPLDRKKQYRLDTDLLQQHINYLNYVVDQFQLPIQRLAPIFYAIERLTEDGISLETLSVALVINQLKDMHVKVCQIDKTREEQAEHNKGLKRSEWDTTKHPYPYPVFVVSGLKKFNWAVIDRIGHSSRFRNFAEWKAQFFSIESADLPKGNRNSTACKPQNFGCNSIRHITYDTTKERACSSSDAAPSTGEAPLADLPRALAVQVAEQAAELARLKALLAEKEQCIQQLQQATQQPTPATLPTQLIEPEQTTQQQEHVITSASNSPSPTPSASTPRSEKAPSPPARTHQGKPTSSSKQGASTLAEPPPVIDGDMQHRIDEMFGWFDALRRSVTTTSRCYGRTASATTSIHELLASHPLPIGKEQLEQVYLALWNEPENKQTHYHQRNHMTIESVCKQFDRKLIAIEASTTALPTATSLGGYHFWQPPEGEGELVTLGPKRKRG